MTDLFILICKSPSGVIYPSHVLCTLDGLRRAFEDFNDLGVKVLDVKMFKFNPADYE